RALHTFPTRRSSDLVLGLYLAPKASKGFNTFKYKYLKSNKDIVQTQNIYRQINDNDFIYVSSFNPKSRRGNNFTLEHFEGNKLRSEEHTSELQSREN